MVKNHFVVIFSLFVMLCVGCDIADAKASKKWSIDDYELTREGIVDVIMSGDVEKIMNYRDRWGRKLVPVEKGRFGRLKSLGFDPQNDGDDILIDYSDSDVEIRWNLGGVPSEYCVFFD